MGVTLPTVDKACIVCLDLKTGVIILGVINLIGCIAGVITTISAFATYTQHYREWYKALGPMLGNMELDTAIHITLSVVLIICIIDMIVVSLLIHGARKDRPGFLIPWIVFTAIYLVLQIIHIILKLISLASAAFISGLVGLLFHGYLFVVVWSLRKKLQGGNAEDVMLDDLN